MTERKKERERVGIENCLGKSQFGAQKESRIDQLTIYSQMLCKWHDLIGLPSLAWDWSYRIGKHHPRERQVQLTSSSRVSTKHRLFQTQLEKAGWGDWGNSKQEVFDRALGILFLGYSIFLLFQILLLLNPFLQPKSWPCLQSITLSLQ